MRLSTIGLCIFMAQSLLPESTEVLCVHIKMVLTRTSDFPLEGQILMKGILKLDGCNSDRLDFFFLIWS